MKLERDGEFGMFLSLFVLLHFFRIATRKKVGLIDIVMDHKAQKNNERKPMKKIDHEVFFIASEKQITVLLNLRKKFTTLI